MRTFRSKLGGFMPRIGADVAQLAAKMRQQLLARPDVDKLREVLWDPRVPEGSTTRDMLYTFLTDLPDEGFKLFPWVVREFKKGAANGTWRPNAPGVDNATRGITFRNKQHALDIVRNAIQWMVWSQEHHKPLPDMMSKQFGFPQLEAWVYEMNAAQAEQNGGWTDSKEVYRFPDGWHIDEVGSGDLAREGELMGHCVGGYCHTVDSGHSTIFSLRDPKGEPHVTIEAEGKPFDSQSIRNGFKKLKIIQVQGKQNREPIPEYREKVDEWFDYLREDHNFDIEEDDPEREPEYVYDEHMEGPFHFDEPENVLDYHDLMSGHDRDYHFGEDEEGDWQDNNEIHYQNPRALLPPEGGASFAPLAAQFVRELLSNPNQYDEGEITRFVQGLWMAVNHYDATNHNYGAGPDHWKLDWDRVINAAKQEAEKYQSTPPRKPKQPTLFEPDEYSTQRSVPMAVQAAIRYMEELRSAPTQYEAPVTRWGQDAQGNYGYQPTDQLTTRHLVFPGEGGYPVTDFPDYFNHIGMPGLSMAGTFARYIRTSKLVEKLVKLAVTQPFPFIYDPHTNDIHWGEPGGFHWYIENDLMQQGMKPPPHGWYGRFYPKDNRVDIYDPVFKDLPPREQEKHLGIVGRNTPLSAPETPQEAPGGHGTDSWYQMPSQSEQDDWMPFLG